jgi:hypothetical protein
MPLQRKTAIVELLLPSGDIRESLPLTLERQFSVNLSFDGQAVDALKFSSPVNDAGWRDFLAALSKCNVDRSLDNYDLARNIRNLGRDLYLALAGLSPELADFLNQSGTPRRLVIQTKRPELHLLPWGALYDRQGNFLAAGDLSIVQSWDRFAFDQPLHFSESINLVQDFGADTLKRTSASLSLLPPEITRDPLPMGALDILHMEEQGDAIANQIGGRVSTSLVPKYKDAKMALLWSCYSGSGGNSWGDSPALVLHRGGDLDANTTGAALVLSFQAELNYIDAKSISEAFYADVFGPAATRDPESALVRIRAAKFDEEFEYANWASMVVYLRQPLDLSALPLNGPRVPDALWTAEIDPSDLATLPAWNRVAAAVAHLQPGSLSFVDSVDKTDPSIPLAPEAPLPLSLFKPWRGNVIRLDGGENVLPDQILRELHISPADAPTTGDADRLVWFFSTIQRFGAPLIVWTNSRPHHLEFLKLIDPPSTLTFLLLYGPEPVLSLAELVDHNDLAQARDFYQKLSAPTDQDHATAYFAFCRNKDLQADAELCLSRIQNNFERLLLSGNFVSRFKTIPRPAELIAHDSPGLKLQGLNARQVEEDFYRKAIDAASGETLLRDRGRARHELAYCMNAQNRTHTAEVLYRMALQDLERSPQHDTSWHSALANTLRDWANLLARSPERVAQANTLLDRALAIHAFHGRRLQIAYSLSTRAQIALTSCHTRQAIDDAIDSCNRFEDCGNWDGWSSAFAILLDALADTREAARMLQLIELANDKVHAASLSASAQAKVQRTLQFRRAQAHWIAGNVSEARVQLENLEHTIDDSFAASDLGQQLVRLKKFLFVQSAEG